MHLPLVRRPVASVLLSGLLGLSLLAACSSTIAAAAAVPATYHGDNSRTGYTADSSITASNAANLKQRWGVGVGAAISDQPIVDNGVVYWGDWAGNMHATSVSGKMLWSTNLGTSSKPKACPFNLASQGIVSSPTVGTLHGKKLVWVGGGTGQLVALNESTGSIVWSKSLGKAPEYVTWASPALYDGSIYEGVASFNDCPVVNGSVYRVNASTGAVQAVLHLAEKASCIGPGVWSSPTIDPSDNSIFVSTSNANPRSNPNATCQIPDQEAVLKLDSSTLVVKALWGLSPSQQVGDSDFGATPMLFSATIGGADRQLVGAENKNGVYYALDREDLASGPVWSYQAEDAAALSSRACEDLNTISSSAWAGPGSPVMVAGITLSGSKCIGTLAALDPATGRPEWQVPLQGPVLGAVTEGSGIVAVGAASSLDVLSSSTGERLFSYTEPKPRARVGKGIYGAPVDWFWGPPTIAGKDLYAANQDGRLRAFSQPAAQ